MLPAYEVQFVRKRANLQEIKIYITHLLTIPLIKNHLPVPGGQIVRIEASSKYSCVIFCRWGKAAGIKNSHLFEERLPTGMFARVHRSHLINTAFISEIIENGSCSLLLQNGDRIELSRRKKTDFINNYRQLRPVDVPTNIGLL